MPDPRSNNPARLTAATRVLAGEACLAPTGLGLRVGAIVKRGHTVSKQR